MSSRIANILAVGAMFAGVLAAYLPAPGDGRPTTLRASDYHLLHQRRISFAIQHLLSESPRLPAWYSRELLGTPFRANLQNFPLIPTRLPLLLISPDDAMAAGAMIAATLASLFTFLYARRVGLPPLGAAVAGWSFATAGFFASRVMAGHLPLLEAYPALPLLAWLIERCIGDYAVRTDLGWRLAWLSFAAAAVMLAGHPQLPAYAMGIAVILVLCRATGSLRWRMLGALALGVALAAFALLPMLLLIQRSTRILALGPAYNDVSLPAWRALSLLSPWTHGWPASLAENRGHVFAGGDDMVFWDTVIYLGLLPVVAAVCLALQCIARRRLPASPWLFCAVVGLLAAVTALPSARHLFSFLPGTWLRSPARQFYVTTFALALAAGVGTQLCWNLGARRKGWRFLAVVAIAANAADVTIHDRCFIQNTPPPRMDDVQRNILAAAGDARVAFDFSLPLSVNREIDDIGFFDSLMLARPYRAVLRLAGRPETANIQEFDGSGMNASSLAWLGVKYVLTAGRRTDLKQVGGWPGVQLYEVPNPSPRAVFVEGASPNRTGSVGGRPASWRRDGPDAMAIDMTATVAGHVVVLEAADDGWHATVDGTPAPIVVSDEVFIAVAVGPGTHTIRLEYRTPGALAGACVSAGAVFALAAVIHFHRRRSRL